MGALWSASLGGDCCRRNVYLLISSYLVQFSSSLDFSLNLGFLEVLYSNLDFFL